MICSGNMCSPKSGLTLLLFIVTQASSSGIFKLNLLQFNNDNGHLDTNACCNGQLTQPDGICSEQCSTYLRICLKHFEANIDINGECTFGEYTTKVLGNNSFIFPKERGDFTNPVEFNFQFAWRGDFSLIFEAYHETVPQEQNLIARFQGSGSASPHDSGQLVTWNSTDKALKFHYSVECNENYYGSGCVQHCFPRNDELGHYECGPNGEQVCRQGWEGEFCSKAICLEGCDSEHGSCRKPNECSCSVGWQGRLCNECVTYPDCDHGYCMKEFQCVCHEGWGGLFCNQDLNYCTNNKPCQNGGTCTNTGEGSYTCGCPIGFTGTDCEIEVDNCRIQQCENGGTCKDVGNDFVCNCPMGYAGPRCEIRAFRCDENPCTNGGSCEPIGNSYRCNCAPGWGGVNCQQNKDDCASDPCKNGGRCIDKVNDFDCVCPPGFSGSLCEVDRDYCQGQNPCQNGGDCLDRENKFECRCRPGFDGANCEIDVNDCVTRPCANGGTCIDKVNDFQCTCAPGFRGRYCNEQINECASAPCKNGGTCHDFVANYLCSCPKEYEGEQCQYELGKAPKLTPLTTTLPPLTEKPKTPAPVKVDEINDGGTNNPDEVALTGEQLILIITLGSGVPMLLLLLLVSLLLYRRCKKRANDSNSEEIRQNEINGMNNRMIHNEVGKAGKDEDYPTADKLANMEATHHSVSLNFKNETAAQSTNKVVHKDLLKDINTAKASNQLTLNSNCLVNDTKRDSDLSYFQKRLYHTPSACESTCESADFQSDASENQYQTSAPESPRPSSCDLNREQLQKPTAVVYSIARTHNVSSQQLNSQPRGASDMYLDDATIHKFSATEV